MTYSFGDHENIGYLKKQYSATWQCNKKVFSFCGFVRMSRKAIAKSVIFLFPANSRARHHCNEKSQRDRERLIIFLSYIYIYISGALCLYVRVTRRSAAHKNTWQKEEKRSDDVADIEKCAVEQQLWVALGGWRKDTMRAEYREAAAALQYNRRALATAARHQLDMKK